MSDGWSALAHSTSQLPALGMGMIGMRQRNEDRDIALGIQKERLGMQEETAKQAALVHQGQLANAEAKIPQHQKVMDPGMILQAQVATKRAYGDAGLKAFSPIFDTAKEIAGANEKSTFGDVYESVKSAYPAQREQMMSTLEKELTSGKLSPVEQQKLQQVYDAVTYDKTGDRILGEGIFKNTAMAMKMEQENSRSNIVAAQQGGFNARADERNERIRDISEENRQLRRDLADKKGAGGGDKAEKEAKKETDKTVRRIDEQIRLYDKEISEYTKRMDKADAKDSQWYQDAIDARIAEKEKAIATKNAVLNDGAAVQWGGSKEQTGGDNRSVKLVEDGWGYLGGDKADPKNWKKM